MKLIIDIDEDVRIAISRVGLLRIPNEMLKKVDKAIQRGTPLPKGHGRLKDADEIIEQVNNMADELDNNFTIADIEKVGTLLKSVSTIIEADKEQEDTYKYLLHGAESLVKDHPDLVRDIWNCSSCEHTEDECKDCYPELGYKNNKLKRDTEAVSEFVKSDTFKKLMESLDEQDRDDKEDVEQFLRDIKEHEE